MYLKKPIVSIVIPTYNRKYMLIRLIKSILNSNYPKNKIEIIVIDNASTDGTFQYIKNYYRNVKIIKNDYNLFASKARNIGIKNSSGKYIFFIDDDNVIDRYCIRELVNLIKQNENIGVVGPLMYYFSQPQKIWCAGVRLKMSISVTKFILKNKNYNKKIKKIIECDCFPNAFMTKREIINKIGLFDEENFPIHYEEFDYCKRVKNLGYKVLCITRAKIFHDIKINIKNKTRLLHINNSVRAYYNSRNRILFHKKHSKIIEFIIFLLTIWLFYIYHFFIILFYSKNRLPQKLNILKFYLKGIKDGLKKSFI